MNDYNGSCGFSLERYKRVYPNRLKIMMFCICWLTVGVTTVDSACTLLTLNLRFLTAGASASVVAFYIYITALLIKNLPSTKLSFLYSFFQTNSKSNKKCFCSSKAPLGACRRHPPNSLCGRATSLTELLHFSLSICSRDTTCRVSVGWSCRCSHSNSSHSTLNNQSASPAGSPAVAAGCSMRDKSVCRHTHTSRPVRLVLAKQPHITGWSRSTFISGNGVPCVERASAGGWFNLM